MVEVESNKSCSQSTIQHISNNNYFKEVCCPGVRKGAADKGIQTKSSGNNSEQGKYRFRHAELLKMIAKHAQQQDSSQGSSEPVDPKNQLRLTSKLPGYMNGK